MKKLQVLLHGEWKLVQCAFLNCHYPITTSDRDLARTSDDIAIFQSHFPTLEFRPEP